MTDRQRIAVESIDLGRRCITTACYNDYDLLISQLDEFSHEPLVLTGAAIYLASVIASLTEFYGDIKTPWGEVMLNKIYAGEQV